MPELKCKVAVVTDSTSSLTPAMGEKYDLHVIPEYVMFGVQSYYDGVNLDAETFYRLLKNSEKLPTTSQPSVQDFVKFYSALSEKAEAIISIHISQKMSATLDSARAACQQLPGMAIQVIDSQSVSMGLGMIAIAAARAAAEGKELNEVVSFVERLIPKVNVIFTVDTLEYLHKGGRIGGATALLGTALSIKPVLYIKDGRIEPLEKVRTKKRAIGRILDLMAERAGKTEGLHAAVMHCNAWEEAQTLGEEVKARFHPAELIITEAGPIIGTHGGPGTLGVVFYIE
ncbi:MAG TPA: DegV family protein [Anaerolineales bacterium]|nr:DegV family protein [Anaerolineales bacterium]